MYKSIVFLVLLWAGLLTGQEKYVLVIHGGAGTILKSQLSEEKERLYHQALSQALKAGFTAIQNGEDAQQAVSKAIMVLEDSPLFNAGKGAVFTHEGKNEMDAAIMLGHSLKAGAVSGIQTVKNPIKAAIAVMQHSPHVMLSGKGAEEFSRSVGLEIVDPSYFYTKERWKGLEKARQSEKKDPSASNSIKAQALHDYKFGTVGAVALDQKGHLAAGTSTGGMTNKRWNRIGDAPIIGAGTYANHMVGVSATGWGEFFIRTTAARSLAALMEYKGLDVASAASQTIEHIASLGGDGGLIALDSKGNVALPFNTAGMYRGYITESGTIYTFIYK